MVGSNIGQIELQLMHIVPVSADLVWDLNFDGAHTRPQPRLSMTHSASIKTPNSVSAEPGAGQCRT
jgi:hypothetical protein